MAERVPGIIRETVASNPDYPVTIKDDFERLHDNVVGNAPVRLFAAPAPDFDIWKACFQPFRNDTWLNTEWLFSEMLVYRLMVEAGRYLTTLRDPFEPFKREELNSNSLWEVLAGAIAEEGSLEYRLTALLRRSLWGNRIDLSLKQTAALGTIACEDHLLVDHIPLAARHLLEMERGEFHLIADNAGTELALDLALGDLLLSDCIVEKLVFHVKMLPVLVSDAIVADVHLLLDCMAGKGKETGALSARLLEFIESGRLSFVPDFVWNTPRLLRDLPPRLLKPMGSASLVVAKGDINYRRVTNDAIWPSKASFSDAINGFPAPLLVLRTLKSDTLVGVGSDLKTRLDEEAEPDWQTSGKYAVAQFAP